MSSEAIMRIAILVTNTDQSDFAARHPPEQDRFTAMMHLVRPDWQFCAVDVVNHRPPDPRAQDGFIITGSPASANDKDPWVDRLKGFIRAAHDVPVPLFGACFGHQVIAAALGGVVEQKGWRAGLYETPGSVAWGDGGGPIRLYAHHKDQVTVLPDGARLLGGTADCPVGAYDIPGRVFATQYHPEMPKDFVADLLECFADEVGPGPTARARASMAEGSAEMARFAESVARFFEAASG
jgi:GMP synthase-like glutamine amidotransferase